MRSFCFRGKSKLPTKDAQVKHIFRDAPEHLADTPANRALLETTANNSKNFLGVDKYGASWYAEIQPDGSQIWVKTYNGTISNGGVNQMPVTFDSATGLNQNPFAK